MAVNTTEPVRETLLERRQHIQTLLDGLGPRPF